MSARKLIRNAVTTFVTTLILSSHYAYAVNGEVLFSAVDNGKAILREVKWEIVGLDSHSLQHDKRHTFTAELPPGKYIAKLTCDGRNYERPFDIVTPFHNVVIECAGH
ncbi:MAG: hypothetical protein L3K52_00570 [Candidatus Thiothrix sulfatifontis]|uniref:Uncharacterized protein n=1 Tax=Thiothrix subterranea TaxID=2735563 RepID=A0AA51R5Z6_9GAMM|nr:hypothetical protein [Thiothrix subterranea]MDQ5769099.1 hypothetical protein [Thiothrix subterranea]QQZ29697.1 hypothetical protein HMY34_13455 [Thiothrix subterranea]UOG92243.1 MAG: hypothetical protein L3K52_00570 [Candidatus Thiothrix sulfatifontis]WML88340.1 hypothetical protein RCG00_08150 [Thiothrix subterranea]